MLRLRQDVVAGIAARMYPRRVVIPCALPKTALGGFQRCRLRQSLGGRQAISAVRTSSGHGIEVCLSSQLAAST